MGERYLMGMVLVEGTRPTIWSLGKVRCIHCNKLTGMVLNGPGGGHGIA